MRIYHESVAHVLAVSGAETSCGLAECGNPWAWLTQYLKKTRPISTWTDNTGAPGLASSRGWYTYSNGDVYVRQLFAIVVHMFSCPS